MARDSAIYIVDVYVPNEGEPDSALELSILRINDLNSRPSVYVHSYIMPSNYHLARIRWSNAHINGISQELFRDANWPSLYDIINSNFLKDKQVVCFCHNIDPVQTLVENADSCFSVLNSWQEVFAGNELASSLTTYSQMLEYMGLNSEDFSNTGYTPSLKRAHAYIAIWLYLCNCTGYKEQPEYGDNTLAENCFWPLQNVPNPWYEGTPKVFDDIPFEALCNYFSERLPDYINWSTMCIYGHDWVLGRERNITIKLANQDQMLNFIFQRTFNLKKRIMVLSFYSLFCQRTDYARHIALHQGQFSSLEDYIKEDFGYFILSHLDDFLSASQKEEIIENCVSQVIEARFNAPEDPVDYDLLLKSESDRNAKIEKKCLDLNSNIFWYKEITVKKEVIYRRFTIKGSTQERNECIDHVNEKINALIREAQDPFAPCWLSEELTEWIQSITGFTWRELSRPLRASDSESLNATRQTIQNIILKNNKMQLNAYKVKFKKIIEDINHLPEGQRSRFTFTFMSITHEVIVDKTGAGSGIIGWLKKIF